MPRYYFNIFNGRDLFDHSGTVLPGTKEVRQHMLHLALEHIEQAENQPETWQMEALDEEGKIVGTMDFGLEDGRVDDAEMRRPAGSD